jgi:hypothetical protein
MLDRVGQKLPGGGEDQLLLGVADALLALDVDAEPTALTSGLGDGPHRPGQPKVLQHRGVQL